MERWFIALVVFGVAILAVAAQSWASWLEHRRRSQTLDVIKAAIEAGREPPPQLYAQLSEPGAGKGLWVEFFVFTMLSAGFWIAYANAEGDQRTAFLIVAGTMSVTAIACLGFSLVRMRKTRGHDGQ